MTGVSPFLALHCFIIDEEISNKAKVMLLLLLSARRRLMQALLLGNFVVPTLPYSRFHAACLSQFKNTFIFLFYCLKLE